MDAVMTFRQAEHPLRARLKSAPPVLFAAMKYGRQLRRITDEFDTLLNKGVRLTGTGLLFRKFSHLWPTMIILFLPPCLKHLPSDDTDVERQSSITEKAVPHVLKLPLEP